MHKIKNIKSKILKRTSTLRGIRHLKNEDSTVNIVFRLKKTQENFSNEVLHICGSLPELGNGIAERSPIMTKGRDGYWEYTLATSIDSLERKRKELSNSFEGNPHGYFFTFNYVVVAQENGKSILKYEEIPKRGISKAPLLKESTLEATLSDTLESSNEIYKTSVTLDHEWNWNEDIISSIKPEIPIPEEERLKGKETSINESPSATRNRRMSMPEAIVNDPRYYKSHIEIGTTEKNTLGAENPKIHKRSQSFDEYSSPSMTARNAANVVATKDDNNAKPIEDEDFHAFRTGAREKVFDWYYTLTKKEDPDEDRRLKREEKKKLKKSIAVLKEEQKLEKKKSKESRRLSGSGTSSVSHSLNSSANSVIIDKDTFIPSTVSVSNDDHQMFYQPRTLSQDMEGQVPTHNNNGVISRNQFDTVSNINVNANSSNNDNFNSEVSFYENGNIQDYNPHEALALGLAHGHKRQHSKEDVLAEERACEKRRKEESDRIFKSQLNERTTYDLRRSQDKYPIISFSGSASNIKFNIGSNSNSNSNSNVTNKQSDIMTAEKVDFELESDQVIEHPIEEDKTIYHTEHSGVQPGHEIFQENSLPLPIQNSDSNNIEKLEKLENDSIEKLKLFEQNPNFSVECTPNVRLPNIREFSVPVSPRIPPLSSQKFESSTLTVPEYQRLSEEEVQVRESNPYTLLSYADILSSDDKIEETKTDNVLEKVEELIQETEPLLQEDKSIQLNEIIANNELEISRENSELKQDEIETERELQMVEELLEETSPLLENEEEREIDDDTFEDVSDNNGEFNSQTSVFDISPIKLATPLVPEKISHIDESQVHVNVESEIPPVIIQETIHNDLENKMENVIASIDQQDKMRNVFDELLSNTRVQNSDSNSAAVVVDMKPQEDKMKNVFDELLSSTKGKEATRRPVWNRADVNSDIISEDKKEKTFSAVNDSYEGLEVVGKKIELRSMNETEIGAEVIPRKDIKSLFDRNHYTEIGSIGHIGIFVLILLWALIFQFYFPESFFAEYSDNSNLHTEVGFPQQQQLEVLQNQ